MARNDQYFGKNLHFMLIKNGLSQAELSELTGINCTMISRYLCGHQVPRTNTVMKFAKLFEVGPDWFFQPHGWNDYIEAEVEGRDEQSFTPPKNDWMMEKKMEQFIQKEEQPKPAATEDADDVSCVSYNTLMQEFLRILDIYVDNPDVDAFREFGKLIYRMAREVVA